MNEVDQHAHTMHATLAHQCDHIWIGAHRVIRKHREPQNTKNDPHAAKQYDKLGRTEKHNKIQI